MREHETATALDYEAIVLAQATPKQIDDLEEMPNRLPFLTLEQIVEHGITASRNCVEMNALIQEELALDTPNTEVLEQAVLSAHLFGRTCLMIADELERRRTGVAPRSRKMH